MNWSRGPDLTAVKQQIAANSIGFLSASLTTALILAQIASHAGRDVENRNRTQRMARRGYDKALALRQGLDIPANEDWKLEGKLSRLKEALISLGETF
jgi:hypothetical protein